MIISDNVHCDSMCSDENVISTACKAAALRYNQRALFDVAFKSERHEIRVNLE